MQRQQCAKVLLNLMAQGKRILNIDETWIDRTNYRRMRWRAPGESHTVPGLVVSPRLAVITAIDNYGRLYMAMT